MNETPIEVRNADEYEQLQKDFPTCMLDVVDVCSTHWTMQFYDCEWDMFLEQLYNIPHSVLIDVNERERIAYEKRKK